MSQTTLERIIISGGGTGGHIFPAISIAQAIRAQYPECEILFVGAEGKMEMTRVPQAGFNIKALPVRGLDRKHLWRNISVLRKLLKSLKMAKRIILDFKPQAVVGVGGYASLPTLLTAQNMGIPTVIQEQNSFAGKANKRLADRAAYIAVAYEGMERFFPADKVRLTGNPVRPVIEEGKLPEREEAARLMGIEDTSLPILLSVGGSLGAKTLNDSIAAGLEQIAAAGVALIWQTGKGYYEEAKSHYEALPEPLRKNIVVLPFVEHMDWAYGAADLMISRSGASTVSEIEILGMPAILVPSPNVAEDHQTHNAKALSTRGAAVLVTDADARATLVSEALKLIGDKEALAAISAAAKEMALRNAPQKIVNLIEDAIAKTHDNE